MKISVNMTINYHPSDGAKTKRAKEIEISRALQHLITEMESWSMNGCDVGITNVGKVTLPGYHPRVLIK